MYVLHVNKSQKHVVKTEMRETLKQSKHLLVLLHKKNVENLGQHNIVFSSQQTIVLPS